MVFPPWLKVTGLIPLDPETTCLLDPVGIVLFFLIPAQDLFILFFFIEFVSPFCLQRAQDANIVFPSGFLKQGCCTTCLQITHSTAELTELRGRMTIIL